ncbi:hypothetical protein [Microvirga antarctica]|nr:hypothetical protein [Microvirga antarctica]
MRGPLWPLASAGLFQMDIIMLALGLGFFGLAFAYAAACDQL